MFPNKRVDWVTRQHVSIGLTVVKESGRTAGAEYMCKHGVPIKVALRTIWGVTRPMGNAV